MNKQTEIKDIENDAVVLEPNKINFWLTKSEFEAMLKSDLENPKKRESLSLYITYILLLNKIKQGKI
jgi:hypothetical protein